MTHHRDRDVDALESAFSKLADAPPCDVRDRDLSAISAALGNAPRRAARQSRPVRLTVRALAVASVSKLLFSSAAFAGALPDPVQDRAAQLTLAVPVDVPSVAEREARRLERRLDALTADHDDAVTGGSVAGYVSEARMQVRAQQRRCREDAGSLDATERAGAWRTCQRQLRELNGQVRDDADRLRDRISSGRAGWADRLADERRAQLERRRADFERRRDDLGGQGRDWQQRADLLRERRQQLRDETLEQRLRDGVRRGNVTTPPDDGERAGVPARPRLTPRSR